MILSLALFAFAQTAPVPPQPNPCDYVERNLWDPKFTPGQRWTYHLGSADAGSTITIAEIDTLPDVGFIVHVIVNEAIFRPDLRNHPLLGPNEYLVMHRDALDASVISLLDNVPIPALTDYSRWRAHCIAEISGDTVADTLTALKEKRCQEMLKLTKHGTLPCKAESKSPAAPSVAPSPSSKPKPPATAEPTPEPNSAAP